MAKLVLFPNPCKKDHESWKDGRDLMNYPCPSRICLLSAPGRGKTTNVLNLILKAQPHYEKIFLSHPALMQADEDEEDVDEDDVVKEYTGIDYIPIYDIPTPKYFDNGSKKQAWILDDVELRNLNKAQKKNLNKCLSYSSTHYNLTIILAVQDPFSQALPMVMRFCNIFVLYKYNDLLYTRLILTRMGINKQHQEHILNEMKSYETHDNLVVDLSENAPHRYRKNHYSPVLKDIDT